MMVNEERQKDWDKWKSSYSEGILQRINRKTDEDVDDENDKVKDETRENVNDLELLIVSHF